MLGCQKFLLGLEPVIQSGSASPRLPYFKRSDCNVLLRYDLPDYQGSYLERAGNFTVTHMAQDGHLVSVKLLVSKRKTDVNERLRTAQIRGCKQKVICSENQLSYEDLVLS